jgi:membrane fusion protein, multidrug efflux system
MRRSAIRPELLEAEIAGVTDRRPILRRRIVAGTAGVLIALLTVVAAEEALRRHAQDGRFQISRAAGVLIDTTIARITDVKIYLDGVWTTQALNTVTVSSQVDGKLTKIFFTEGQDVEKGFVLAQIDPTVYQAQFDQAVAKKAQDEATLANARVDLVRYVNLAKTQAGPQQQADTQKALVEQLEAQVEADQATIDSQHAYLVYTKIVAPISGRTGIRQVDAGNIVQGAENTPIVVITQLQPISIIFTLPQQQLGAVNRALAAGAVSVIATASVDNTIVERGTLKVVDNLIDPSTGTLKLKSEFANADFRLWPGQFIDVRVQVDVLRGVVVVPVDSVQAGPDGPFVFVVSNDNRAVVRPVVVTRQADALSVIGAGLREGERLATSGFSQLADGTRVSLSSKAVPVGNGNASASAPPPDNQLRQRDQNTTEKGDQPAHQRERHSEHGEAAGRT